MADEQQKKPIDDASTEQDKQTTVLDNSPKRQKKIDEITSTSTLTHPHILDHQDILFNGKNADYYSFSTTNKKPSESNPIQQVVTSDPDSDEDEQKKKIAAAKKLLFPSPVATSCSEVIDTLRNERRQEFCPIYKDETPEEISLRQTKQKPVGSLLAKRIRWDDLKRKRDEEEKKRSQIPYRYGPYGPMYANQQQSFTNSYEQYNGKMQNQPQQSFANPYEQYYAAMQNQYEQVYSSEIFILIIFFLSQMAQMARAQQEYNGFWPEYQQQLLLQNNNQLAQNSMQQQSQPYTYPYPAMYSSNMTRTHTNIPSSSSYTSNDNNSYLNNLMQPPPPPPNEPYPY